MRSMSGTSKTSLQSGHRGAASRRRRASPPGRSRGKSDGSEGSIVQLALHSYLKFRHLHPAASSANTSHHEYIKQGLPKTPRSWLV